MAICESCGEQVRVIYDVSTSANVLQNIDGTLHASSCVSDKYMKYAHRLKGNAKYRRRSAPAIELTDQQPAAMNSSIEEQDMDGLNEVGEASTEES